MVFSRNSILSCVAMAVVAVALSAPRAVSAEAKAPSKQATAENEILAATAAFVAAFNRNDAQAVAALWTADGTEGDDSGTIYKGRPAIEAQYAQLFKQHPGAWMEVAVKSIEFPAPSAAIEDGVARIETEHAGPPRANRYTIVHVKQDGKWLMAGVREANIVRPSAKVVRGDVRPIIEATGTLEPEAVVDIGPQVNGLITELKVDYNSKVEANQVLAVIDPLLYQATVDQNQAALNKFKADLEQMKANVVLAQANMKRDDELLKRNAISSIDHDAAVAALQVAKANVGVEEAAIEQAKGALNSSKVNLGYCKITAPVKGTIIDRRVNVGQTVVSSLSASSLFLLAKDLSRMQVWASVNEADVGRIHEGTKVHYTVDAYPGSVFYGEVLQVRLNATLTRNVVTYTVVVTTDNKDMKLLPYMTANLKFEIEDDKNGSDKDNTKGAGK